MNKRKFEESIKQTFSAKPLPYFFEGDSLEDVPVEIVHPSNRTEFCAQHPDYEKLIRKAKELISKRMEEEAREKADNLKYFLVSPTYYKMMLDMELDEADIEEVLGDFDEDYSGPEEDWNDFSNGELIEMMVGQFEPEEMLAKRLQKDYGVQTFDQLSSQQLLHLYSEVLEYFDGYPKEKDDISDFYDFLVKFDRGEYIDPISGTQFDFDRPENQRVAVDWFFENARRFEFDPRASLPNLPYYIVPDLMKRKRLHPMPETYIGMVPIEVTNNALKTRFPENVPCLVIARNMFAYICELNTKTWKLYPKLSKVVLFDGRSQWSRPDPGELLDISSQKQARQKFSTFPAEFETRGSGVFRNVATVQWQVYILHRFSVRDLERTFGTVTLNQYTKMYHADGSGQDWFLESPIRGPAFFACNVNDTEDFGITKLCFFSRKPIRLLDLINDSRTRKIEIGFEPYGRSLLRYCIYGTTRRHNELGYHEDRDAEYLRDIGIKGWFSYDHGNVADGEIMLCNPENDASLYAIGSYIHRRDNSASVPAEFTKYHTFRPTVLKEYKRKHEGKQNRK